MRVRLIRIRGVSCGKVGVDMKVLRRYNSGLKGIALGSSLGIYRLHPYEWPIVGGRTLLVAFSSFCPLFPIIQRFIDLEDGRGTEIKDERSLVQLLIQSLC